MDTEYLIRIDGRNFAWRMAKEDTVKKLRSILTGCGYTKVFEITFREYAETNVIEVIEESFQIEGAPFGPIPEKVKSRLTDNGFAVE